MAAIHFRLPRGVYRAGEHLDELVAAFGDGFGVTVEVPPGGRVPIEGEIVRLALGEAGNEVDHPFRVHHVEQDFRPGSRTVALVVLR